MISRRETNASLGKCHRFKSFWIVSTLWSRSFGFVFCDSDIWITLLCQQGVKDFGSFCLGNELICLYLTSIIKVRVTSFSFSVPADEKIVSYWWIASHEKFEILFRIASVDWLTKTKRQSLKWCRRSNIFHVSFAKNYGFKRVKILDNTLVITFSFLFRKLVRWVRLILKCMCRPSVVSIVLFLIIRLNTFFKKKKMSLPKTD